MNMLEAVMGMLGNTQDRYSALEDLAKQPIDRSFAQSGQTPMDVLLRPTTDQNRALLQMGLEMLGSNPAAHPGEGISKGIQSGLGLYDQIKEREREQKMTAGMLGVKGAESAFDQVSKILGLQTADTIAQSKLSGDYKGSSIEAQHLNNWNAYLRGELPRDDPKVELAQQYLTRDKTVVTPQGTMVYPGYNLEGGSRASGGMVEKPPTEGERKADYINESLKSMNDYAESVIQDKDGNITYSPTVTDALADNLGPLRSFAQSPQYQKYRAAADEWTTATVFLRSGATATKEEKDSTFTNFWPQPGDDPQTIEFKREMRESAMRSASKLGKEAGRDKAGKKKTGGVLMVDSEGNKAIVYPDGTVEEQ